MPASRVSSTCIGWVEGLFMPTLFWAQVLDQELSPGLQQTQDSHAAVPGTVLCSTFHLHQSHLGTAGRAQAAVQLPLSAAQTLA